MLGLIPRDHWEYSPADFLSALVAAFRARKESEKLYLMGVGKCIPVRSGRAALVAAIRALNLPKGARIGVPLYCCSVVFRAICMAGFRPHFIDVDPATFCMSALDLSRKISEVHAVIAVHMFGNLCDMSSLETAAQGKPIIEDCAQALGSRLSGQPAGSFGTIAFFSFRSGKYLSAGEGGALFSCDAAVHSRLSEIADTMPTPGRRQEVAHVAKVYVKSILRSKPLYGLAGYPLWKALNQEINLSARSVLALGQIYRSDLVIATRRLAFLEAAIARQRANADYFARTLRLDSEMLCTETDGAFYNRYLYPIRLPSSEYRDKVASYLHSRNVDTMKYLDDVVSSAYENFGYTGDCRMAEELSKRVLIIPSYYSLKMRDIEFIAQQVNEGWERVSTHMRIRNSQSGGGGGRGGTSFQQ